MKFSTQEDIEAPIDAVFEMLCAFEGYERAAMRRGADIQRLDSLDAPGLGMSWAAKFPMRGKSREIELEIVQFNPHNDMRFDMRSKGLAGIIQFELIALSRNRTRMIFGVEIRPQTLPARLLVQSLKLTKSSLNRQFQERVADYVQSMEERHSKNA